MMGSLSALPVTAVGTSVIIVLAIAVAFVLTRARAKLPDQDAPLVDAIEAVLPHTQCAQCGYPGCRPYAQAVAEGEAIDLCPPGGTATLIALQDLLGESNTSLSATRALAESPPTLLAVIDETECIGCALCIPPCPVDAIVGANKFMHTVLAAHCTGCELCVAPCPVDCISMTEVAKP